MGNRKRTHCEWEDERDLERTEVTMKRTVEEECQRSREDFGAEFF